MPHIRLVWCLASSSVKATGNLRPPRTKLLRRQAKSLQPEQHPFGGMGFGDLPRCDQIHTKSTHKLFVLQSVRRYKLIYIYIYILICIYTSIYTSSQRPFHRTLTRMSMQGHLASRTCLLHSGERLSPGLSQHVDNVGSYFGGLETGPASRQLKTSIAAPYSHF